MLLSDGLGIYSLTEGDDKSFSFSFSFSPAVGYFVSSHWSIEANWAGLSFDSNDNGGNGADKRESFYLNVDFSSINFGMNYKF